MSERKPPRQLPRAAIIFCALLFVSMVDADNFDVVNSTSSTAVNNSNSSNNFNCPLDCQCVMARNTHKPLLHAKCSSIADLRSEAPLRTTLPIHSIDLSHLGLSRVAHALEKLRDLTSVDLSHNELHEFGHLGRRIKKLNLKHNRLSSAKLLKLPQHVQVLNLQHNDITYLPLELTKLRQLQTLELSQNRINCSCQTLQVRNWLQRRHVFMEQPVTCDAPAELRGKSWLQARQADVCDRERRGWIQADDENELMLSDQAIEAVDMREGAESAEEEEEEEELGKAFLPIVQRAPRDKSEVASLLGTEEDFEGSGDLDGPPPSLLESSSSNVEPPLALARVADKDETEEEDGSGSGGGGLLIIPHLEHDPIVLDDFDQPENAPSADIFGRGMGIFDGAESPPQPVTEDQIGPVLGQGELGASPDIAATTEGTTDGVSVAHRNGGGNDIAEDAEMAHAEVVAKDDSNATYMLLGIIALVVLGLLLFVAIKRCKHNRRYAHAAESPNVATELRDMDKQNLGKPALRNGNHAEQAPLINDKCKERPINGSGGGAKKPYAAGDLHDGSSTQQPLLNGSGAAPGNGNAKTPAHEVGPSLPTIVKPLGSTPHEYHPITPRYPPPRSPRASKYGQPEPNGDEDSSLPASPKSGRYSPVYSPETGRVKIKLTETPRPKTPMLVTRSKSNAGDIITTPVHASQLESGAHSPVSGANGHVEH